MGNYDIMDKKNDLSARWYESTFNISQRLLEPALTLFLNGDNGTINPQHTLKWAQLISKQERTFKSKNSDIGKITFAYITFKYCVNIPKILEVKITMKYQE